MGGLLNLLVRDVVLEGEEIGVVVIREGVLLDIVHFTIKFNVFWAYDIR